MKLGSLFSVTHCWRTLFFVLVATETALGAVVTSYADPASTIRHDRTDSSYTNLADAFPATGRLTWPGFLCSGTFIENSGSFGWIVTAGHCVDDGTSASEFEFLVGGNSYAGDAIFTAPTYTNFDDSLAKGDDLALLRLSSTVADVTPATLYTGSDELGHAGTHVGYGKTGTGLTGATEPAGAKRAAENVVDTFGSDFTSVWGDQLVDDFDNPDNASDSSTGDDSPLNLEGLIAPGDSGGGLYIDFGLGSELVGVHSFTGAIDGEANSDYGDLSGSTRVSKYASWIDTTIAANSTAVPEPCSLAAMGVGTLMLVGLRRRRRVKPGERRYTRLLPW